MKNIIIVLGPQGSGKSTQAKMLSEKFNWPIFIAGDQLRNFAKYDSPISREVAQLLSNGKLVPNNVVFDLIDNFLAQNSSSNTFLFDGFPRSLDQCQFLNKLTEKGDFAITALLIDISQQETMKRLAKRAQENLQQRDDDVPEIIEQRLKLYREETLPILNYLESKFRLIKIDGERKIEVIFDDVLAKLREANVIQ